VRQPQVAAALLTFAAALVLAAHAHRHDHPQVEPVDVGAALEQEVT